MLLPAPTLTDWHWSSFFHQDDVSQEDEPGLAEAETPQALHVCMIVAAAALIRCLLTPLAEEMQVFGTPTPEQAKSARTGRATLRSRRKETLTKRTPER